MKKKISVEIINEAAKMLKIIGHPVRLRMIELLENREHSVGEFQRKLKLPQPIISQQLSRLKKNGVVKTRRDRNHVIYSINHPRVIKVLDCIRQCPTSSS